MIQSRMWYILRCLAVLFLVISFLNCKKEEKQRLDLQDWKPLKVSVTAYNSLPSQTTAIDPNIAAWGDTLRPGMKVIAVSRDLMRNGLSYNTMVRIDTFPDTFLVKDKMHFRHRNKIDIYMGIDQKKAKEWGRKKLTIFYRSKNDSLPLKDSLH